MYEFKKNIISIIITLIIVMIIFGVFSACFFKKQNINNQDQGAVKKTIYELKLNECLYKRIMIPGGYMSVYIQRVPGGWNYVYYKSCAFVPYNEEFNK